MDSNMPWSRHSNFNFQTHSQPPSQPSQSNNSSRRQPSRTTDTIEKASWDPRTTEALIRVCVEELQAGNRPGTHFNKTGWDNIVQKFREVTNRKYNRVQLKNRWDTLKKDWGIWQALLRNETGLGWNNEKGTIDASPDWWAQKLQAHPEAAKFRDRGPLLVHEQEILFSDVVATGASAWTPSSGLLPPHLQDETDDHNVHETLSDNDLEFDPTIRTDGTQQMNTEGGSNRTNFRRNNQFPAQIPYKKHKKLSSAEKIARCLEQMVDTLKNESASTHCSVGSGRQFTIQECMNVLDYMSDIEEGGKLWMYATRIFLKPAVRELFLTIKKDEMRLKWLEEQMDRDMQKRSSSTTSIHAPKGDSHMADNASSG